MDKVIKHGLLFSAGFDEKSEQNMRKRVEKIIASASNINFDTPENKRSLQAFIGMFEDMFASVGNKKIDFSKMLTLPGPEMFEAFKASANEVVDVWADVVNRMGSNSLSAIFMKDQSALDAALKNVSQKNGKIKSTFARMAKEAFVDETSTDLPALLDKARNNKQSFSEATSWEQREVAALKYLNVYRRIMEVTQNGLNVDRLSPEYETIFKELDRIGPYATEQLEEVKAYLQTSVQNIFHLANGKPLLNLTDGGAVNFDVSPRLIKTLDVGDIIGGKKNISVDVVPEIDPGFASKLTKLFELSKQKGKEAQEQFAQLQNEIIKDLPVGVQEAAIDRLYRFLETKGTDRAIEGVWKDFVGFGGDGTGTGVGTGIGDGVGSGDASSSEIENIRQQLEDANRKREEAELAERVAQEEATAERHATEAAEERAEMYRRAMDSMQEEVAGLRGQLADADVENNQKRIETYNELSDAVSRYIELAKSLVSTENNTKEHQQISADMERFSWNNMPDDEQGYIEAINKQKKNIDKIKKAIKIGASTYTDEDGYEYRVVDDTLAEAESKLRSYIYHYASEFDNIGALVDGAKTKDLKNVITKEVDKFKADETIQRQQEEIAEAANVAAVKEMEQIEEIIKRSAPTDKADKISDTLNELQLGASRVDRFTQSVKTDSLANDMGILSPHKEIENNAKAIKSYEELCGVIERYNELVKKRYIFTGGEEPTLTADEENEYAELYGRLNATREGVNINKLTGFDGITDIEKLAQLLGIQIPQAAQQAKQSVSGLNNELQTTGDKVNNVDGKLGDGVATGVGQTSGVTAEEVKNLEAVRAKVVEITNEVKEKTQEFLNEQTAVKKVSESEVHALGEVEKKVTAIKVALSNVNTLLNNIKKDKDINDGLSNINITVNHKEDDSAKQPQEAWALEDTLRNKTNGLLGKIVANTDAIKVNTKDVAKDATLKQVLNALNTKMKAAPVSSGQSSVNRPAAKPTVTNAGGNLLKMYERLGALGAQKNALDLNSDERKGIKEKIKLLKEEIDKKRNLVTVDKQLIIEAQKKGAADQKAQAMTVGGRKSDVQAAKDEKKAVNDLLKAYERLGELRANRDALPKGVERDELQKEIKLETSRLWKQSKKLGADSTKTSEASVLGAHNVQMDQLIAKTKELGQYEKDIVSMQKNTGEYAYAENRIKELKSEIALIQKKITLTQEEKLVLDELTKKNARDAQENKLAAVSAERMSGLKQLTADSEKLAKLQAASEVENNKKIQEQIQLLKEKVDEKRKSLHLTDEETASLDAQYNKIFEEEKRILGAAKADKRDKKQEANDLKLAKKQAMVGKAGSAVSRAESVWLEASDINVPGLDEQLTKYQKAFEALRAAQHKVSTSEVVSGAQKTALQEQTKRVNKLTEEIGGLVSEYQRLSGSNTQKMGISSTLGSNSSITAYEQTLKQAVKQFTEGKAQIKGFNAETKTLTYTLKTGANEFTTYTAAVRHLDKQLVTTQGTTQRTETFMEATRRKMKEISSYMSGMTVFSRMAQEFRKGIQYIREIDGAMTELKKVTDATEETYDKFLKTAAKTASRIGSTTREVISSTADWARLGSILANTNIRPII